MTTRIDPKVRHADHNVGQHTQRNCSSNKSIDIATEKLHSQRNATTANWRVARESTCVTSVGLIVTPVLRHLPRPNQSKPAHQQSSHTHTNADVQSNPPSTGPARNLLRRVCRCHHHLLLHNQG